MPQYPKIDDRFSAFLTRPEPVQTPGVRFRPVPPTPNRPFGVDIGVDLADLVMGALGANNPLDPGASKATQVGGMVGTALPMLAGLGAVGKLKSIFAPVSPAGELLDGFQGRTEFGAWRNLIKGMGERDPNFSTPTVRATIRDLQKRGYRVAQTEMETVGDVLIDGVSVFGNRDDNVSLVMSTVEDLSGGVGGLAKEMRAIQRQYKPKSSPREFLSQYDLDMYDGASRVLDAISRGKVQFMVR